MLRFLAFAALLATVLATKRYDGYKVFRITPKDHIELDKLVALKKTLKNHVDFWKSPSDVDRPVDMLISPEYQDLVVDLVKGRDLEVETTVEDLQRDIDEERAGIKAGFSYTDFNKLDEIEGWMDSLAAQYPSLVSVVKVGSSYEKREIKALKIGTDQASSRKKAVWYEGGIHSREWISTATMIYMTKLLVEGYGNDADVTAILDELHVYILPVYNVDGYEFTWTGDRMWRKTRSKNTGSTCRGVDPNRNWDFQWGGESNVKCSETYQGPNAFSEIEVKSVTDYIQGLRNVEAFIDFHAYGLMWMTPWGYTKNTPLHYNVQLSVTNNAVDALKAVYGTRYRTGSIANVIYEAHGSSADWAYGYKGIIHSYAVELRGNSFIVKASEIKPSGIETFEALKYISKYVINN